MAKVMGQDYNVNVITWLHFVIKDHHLADRLTLHCWQWRSEPTMKHCHVGEAHVQGLPVASRNQARNWSPSIYSHKEIRLVNNLSKFGSGSVSSWVSRWEQSLDWHLSCSLVENATKPWPAKLDRKSYEIISVFLLKLLFLVICYTA